MSREESYFADKLDEIFHGWNVIKNFRPDRLKNERTGKNLEIDYYIGKYKIGFEYQGGVHFRNIKEFGNHSDRSRHHDLLKTDMSLSDQKCRKKPLTIVEIFECDLRGDFRKNIIQRIINTEAFYRKKGKYYSSINLVKMLCFIETGVKYKEENIRTGLVSEKFISHIKQIYDEMNKYYKSQKTLLLINPALVVFLLLLSGLAF